jgi:hypothetical protein
MNELRFDEIQSTLVSLYSKLSPKKIKFLESYLLYGNLSKAAKEAGYNSRQYAHKLTKDDIIKKILQLEQQKLLNNNSNKVFQMLKKVNDISNVAHESGDFKIALKAIETEAKLYGLLGNKDKSIEDYSINGQITDKKPVDPDKLSLDELKELTRLLEKSTT